MNKLILTLLMCSITFCSFAQEHLSFKGIPITGNMSSFCQKLKAKGFTSIGTEGNTNLLRGDFTSRQVTVGVTAMNNGEDVYTVVAYFDTSESWNMLVNTYAHYKDLYIEKYGQPKQCIENNPAYSKSNISRMYELGQGKVNYNCVFGAHGGVIQISIEPAGLGKGYVMIKYQDAQNIQAKRQNDIDEI